MDYAEAIEQYMPQIKLAVDTCVRNFANWRLEKDDLIQDALLRLWQQFDQWQAARDMGAYAYQATANTCCTAARKLEQDAISTAVRLPEDEEYD